MNERIVEVEWEDTNTRHHWQRTSEPLPVNYTIRTLGYVLEDSKKRLVVTEAFDDSPEDIRDRGCTTSIPRSAVRKVRELRRGR